MISTISGIVFLLLRLLAFAIALFAIPKLASRILISAGLLVLLVSDGIGKTLSWTGMIEVLMNRYGSSGLLAYETLGILLSLVELFGYLVLLVGFALLSPVSTVGLHDAKEAD
jgi:hypothetical protein